MTDLETLKQAFDKVGISYRQETYRECLKGMYGEQGYQDYINDPKDFIGENHPILDSIHIDLGDDISFFFDKDGNYEQYHLI